MSKFYNPPGFALRSRCEKCGQMCYPDRRFATRILCFDCGDEVLRSAVPTPDDKIKTKRGRNE